MRNPQVWYLIPERQCECESESGGKRDESVRDRSPLIYPGHESNRKAFLRFLQGFLNNYQRKV